MTRFLFDGGELVLDADGNPRGDFEFTVWTDRTGGTNVTDEMRAPDGVSEATVASDPDGEIPYLRGPEGRKAPLYRDTGTDTRSVWRSAEADSDTAVLADETRSILDNTPPALPPGGTQNVDILWRGPTERTGVWAPPPTGTGGGGSSDWNDITNKPTTFSPSPHTHNSGQISDSSTVGRAVLTAADAQTARAAIGAGTGNGTSNLTIGTTSTTAAAGNHTHVASAIPFTPTGSLTATNVQDAIGQSALSGGGSGTSAVMVWEYTSGAYPTLPATQPAGVRILWTLGPTYPTTVPSWVGLGAGKVRLRYSKLALT